VSPVLSASAPRSVLRRRAVTFLELMASVTIVLAAVSVLMPALSSARHAANVAVCLNNLQTIATTSVFYVKDNDPTGTGSRPTQPWCLGTQWMQQYTSEFVYGGYRSTIDHPQFPGSDTYMIPTEVRPYNKYIAPGLGGRFPIKEYVCPSDRSCATPLAGNTGHVPIVDQRYGSWEANGNSYAINWYWANAPPMDGESVICDLPCMSLYGTPMLQKKVGGAAAEFVLFMEGMMNAYMMDARPADGSSGESDLQQLGEGWHRKHSMYAMGFYDGHAEYRFIDTRYTSGAGYDIWPEPDTQWPAGCPFY
jgi:hypothetical protein